jgi:hypothetical protein
MTMIGAVLAVMMNTASASVLPLALPLVIPVSTTKELRKFKRKRRALCTKGAALRHDPERVSKDSRLSIAERSELAGLYWTGEDCRQDQAKAIALLDAIVGDDPTATINTNDVERLIEYHRQYSSEKSLSRIIDLNRMLWMRGGYFPDQSQLGWDQVGMKAFVLSDPIWSWFDKDLVSQFGYGNYQVRDVKIQALLDPTSPRFNFEKGIASAIQHRSFGHIHSAALALEQGKIVPRDPVRAETLLWSNRTWVDTHALLVKRVTPLLDDPDSTVRAKALSDMRELASANIPTSETATLALIENFVKHLKSSVPGEALEAQQNLNTMASKDIKRVSALLIPLIEKQLKSGNSEQKVAAHGSLSALVQAGDMQAKTIANAEIDKAIKRAGGIVDLKTTEGLRFSMSDYDYPASAIRYEEEGLVSVTVIIGPDGKAIKVDQATGTSPRLIAEVSKIALRRTRLKGYEGRYVRAKLPDVLFKIVDTDKEALKELPQNTIVVRGERMIFVEPRRR